MGARLNLQICYLITVKDELVLNLLMKFLIGLLSVIASSAATFELLGAGVGHGELHLLVHYHHCLLLLLLLVKNRTVQIVVAGC